MKGLLIVERFILETIGNNGKSFNEIKEATKLNIGFLKNIIAGLEYRSIITFDDSTYAISFDKKKSIMEELNKSENIKDELKELFTTFVNEFYLTEKDNVKLHVKKVSLDSFEEKILESHLRNLKDFFKSLVAKKDSLISQQKVVIWGECNYLNLVNRSMG